MHQPTSTLDQLRARVCECRSAFLVQPDRADVIAIASNSTWSRADVEALYEEMASEVGDLFEQICNFNRCTDSPRDLWAIRGRQGIVFHPVLKGLYMLGVIAEGENLHVGSLRSAVISTVNQLDRELAHDTYQNMVTGYAGVA